MVVGADAATGTDRTVNQNGADWYSGTTEERSIPYFTFIVTQETFAAVTRTDNSFLSGVTDEVEYLLDVYKRQIYR